MSPAGFARAVVIVKPTDWALIETSHLSVVVSGDLDGTEQCRLVPRDDWVAARYAPHAAYVTAPLHHFAPCHGWAHLHDLTGLLGAFIIAVTTSDGTVLAASGVILARSSNTLMRFQPARLRDRRERTLIFPLALLEFAHSGFKGGGPSADVTILDRERFFSPTAEHRLSATILESEASFDARGALALELCHGTQLARFQELVDKSAWSSSPLYFLMVNDGIVDLRRGIVLTQGGEAWRDSTVASLSGDARAILLNDYVVAEEQLGWVETPSPPILSDERPALVFLHKVSLLNHAHWFMNSLLAVFYALPELIGGKIVLVSPPLPLHVRTVLLRMGVPPSAIFETHAPYLQCRHLVFPSPLSTRANMHPSPSCLPFFEHLKTTFACTYVESMPELVVFTRGGFSSARSMENEAELLAALRGIGFTSIAPHELSMEEEVNVLSRARIVVSQLGAALSNIAFAPAGCTIIEVGTDNYTSNEFLYMAELLGQSYIRIMVEPLSEGFQSNSTFKFRAPVESIIACISEINGRRPALNMT